MMRRLRLALSLALLCAVRADAEPLRIATLLPSVADAVAKLPPERAQLVAAVRRSLHEPIAGGALDLGTPHAPSLERLAEARPQLVVAEQRLHATLADRLGTGGAELLLVDTSSIDATFAGLVAVAARAGAAEEMEARVAEARTALAALKLAQPVATLALFATPGAFLAVTEQTWIGDLLARLGFASVAPSAPHGGAMPGYVPLSDEVLATLRPELLLLLSHGDPARVRAEFERRLEGGPWQGLRASAGRGVHVLDPVLFQANPGLAVVDAARALTGLVASPGVAAK
jgi:iron complex transport system substrate-binding protein